MLDAMESEPVPNPSPGPDVSVFNDPDAVARACQAHPDVAAEIRTAVRALMLAAGTGMDDSAGDSLRGARLGRLHILGRLGGGGMGTVHRAHDPGLNRDLAVKFMPASMANAPGTIERFRREAQALGRIRHKHIVAIHDVGETEGVPWFTMDLVDGDSLRTILDRLAGDDVEAFGPDALLPALVGGQPQPLPREATHAGSYVESVARLVAKLADALEHVHRTGIVHRDVKPGNIMVDRAGEPCLVDFGLARGDDAVTVTRDGSGPGTPAYMAPEQISGRSPVGPSTDVYGLGITLYEALTLRRPFTGDTTQEVFNAVLNSEPAPPRRWNAQIPRDLEIVCLTAIEKDPSRRYPSALAFAEDLRNLLNLRPIRARAAGLGTRARRLLLRNPWPTAAAAALLLATAGLGVVVFVQRMQARAEFRAAVTETHAALAGKDLSQAQLSLERVTALDQNSIEARDLRSAVAAARAEADHGRAIEEARVELDACERSMAAIVSSRARVEILEQEELFAFHPSADPLAWAREAETVGPLIVSAETHLAGAIDALNRAERHVPGTPAVRRAMADLYMIRWRATRSAHDIPMTAAHRVRVEVYDIEGRHLPELEGTASLSLDGSPRGAELHLFRFQLQSGLRDDGEPRLVPVPFHLPRSAARTPAANDGVELLTSAEVALSVTSVTSGSPAAAIGLCARDLITRVAGAPVAGAVLVIELDADGPAARAGVVCLDRLTGLAGSAVHVPNDAVAAQASLVEGANYDVVFAAKDGRRTVSTRRGVSPWNDLGLRVGDAAEALAHVVLGADLELGILSGGVARTLVLPSGRLSGIEGVVTAYPLVFGSDNAVGTLPLVDVSVPAGSYLLVAGMPGYDDLRLPFEIPSSGPVVLRADLLRAGITPPGFVYVAPCPSIFGGDPDAVGAIARRVTDLPGFFIAQREVTVGEYAEFVNDPATRLEIDAAGSQGTVTRVPRRILRVPSWTRAGDGRFIPDVDPRCPVCDIAGVDADAYVAWRNRLALSRGEAWTYALPSKEQWEKAARGADGRVYPWGDAFSWSFCGGRKSRPNPVREPGLSFLADESTFAVRDLCGGVFEWLLDIGYSDPNYGSVRAWRGGAWNAADVRLFRAASDNGGDASRAGFNDGFRLVASLRNPPSDASPQVRR